MKLKRFLALSIAVFVITALFSGCSTSSTVRNSMVAQDSASGSLGNELADALDSAGTVTPQNQKLIRTLYLDAETENMDDLLPKIEARITELGGYVEAREVSNDGLYSSGSYRHASLTIRIPAENLDAFANHVSEQSHITSNRETTEDVTLKYVATESRIAALETEQTRLLELLAQAENMNDLLLIESKLTEVRTELEQVTSLLRLYDNLVDYGTIHLELIQVKQYTEPEPETFWARIGTGFMESLEGLGDFLLELLIFLIVSLPYLVLLGGIAVLVVVLYKRRKKKQKQEDAPPPTV